MRTVIRKAKNTDLSWLINNDVHVKPPWIERCVSHNEYLLAELDGELAGFLRFSMFWGIIPYMDMIGVLEMHRRQGVGVMLLNQWENDMKAQGLRILMTSAMEDEPAPQAWHRRNGFSESGYLTFGRLQEPKEIFFIKNL